MSATKHSRDRGVTVRCDAEGCTEQQTTGVVLMRPNRAYAAKLGWSRGGVGFARADFCPAHKGHEPRWFVEKSEREATAKAERLAAREVRKAARTAAKAEAQPRD